VLDAQRKLGENIYCVHMDQDVLDEGPLRHGAVDQELVGTCRQKSGVGIVKVIGGPQPQTLWLIDALNICGLIFAKLVIHYLIPSLKIA
jgi:hypothetical protein